MRTAARYLLSAMLAASIMLCGGAYADTLPLDDIGLRFEAVQGERCLTRGNLEATAEAVLGLSADTALELMRSEGSYMLIYADDCQITLCVSPAPEGVTARDVSELQAEERDRFLALLRRELAAASSEWVADMPDYALSQSGTGGDMPINSLTMSTLYLGKLYSFRLDAIGRELTTDDSAALLSVVARALRLGATNGSLGTSQPLMLEELSALSAVEATMTLDNANVRLTAASVPSVIGVNQLELVGETDPKAKLRVRVNGEASAAFYPDENGAYSYLARGFVNGKDNLIEIAASIGDLATVLSFSVSLDWLQTPLAVSPLSGFSYEDIITIEGLTLPGAEVQIVKGGSTSSATVDENGLFSFPLYTKKPTGYGFTVRASYPGYKRSELTGKIRRADADDAAQTAKRIVYDELVAEPEKYADVSVSYLGAVEALGYENGTPKCLLKTDDGALYVLLCKDLIGLNVGKTISVIGVLQGTNGTIGGDAREYPELTLEALANDAEIQDGV